MKNLKNIVSVIVLALVMLNGNLAFGQKNIIAKIEKDGKLSIVAKKSKLLKKINKHSKETMNGTIYSDLEIQKYDNKGKTVYLLVAYNKKHTERIATLLEEKGGNLTLYIVSHGGTLSCHTSDCSGSTGCTPVDGGLGWHCSHCTGNCTKTTTIEL